ncbi:gpi anchored protein [Neofusicoccum parvum]|uniref:Gpi anchored protein n=1 Tax=Neofusicoccum parvum TaxID=310453 RepID=A0ACB5RZ67_9PEZI|nr:gpi anchored protein [Neofusicoccum parvum]GME32217.1 gpi anchored protein [Neofusicoccum parvum]
MKFSVLLAGSALSASAAFVHPGMLHTADDFERITTNVNAGTEPWLTGWYKLTNNSHAQSTYTAGAVELLCRGSGASCTENYSRAFNDAAAAYQLAIRWKVTGDEAYGTAATDVINAWSSTLKEISGSSDKYLASGLYGYQFANAAEILREFDGFTDDDLAAATAMLVDIFYPMNHRFFVEHNDAADDHYWANWDLANMCTAISAGILAENQTIFDEAINYFYNGTGNGNIEKLFWIVYDDGTAQVQEAGRDQGHTMLDIGLVGAFATMATNQGINLFQYDDYRILKGSEYAAKYNLGNDVQYTTYVNSDVTQEVISNASRGNIRPIWDLIYNRYVKIEGQEAPYSEQYAQLVRDNGGGAEGGGGDYGPNSGGFDQLGFGTLLFTI